MKKSTRIINIVIILILFFSMINNGCAYSNSMVIGKWLLYQSETPDGKIKAENSPKRVPFEFFSDNTVSGDLGIGNWSILNDGRIKMTFHNMYVMFANLDGDKLIITLQGQKGRFFFKRTN